MKTNHLQSANLELLRLQVQNYACRGCSNCSQSLQQDLRTRSGILNYLITKRSCFLTKLETRIQQLNTQKEKIVEEIKGYQAVLQTWQES